ncbi:hypothetical protein [Sinorhizobium meliloti]|nr:hypothetical protein U8C39_36435 [Sinorhizobium meliloti]WQP20198.1 hypothetical protein U8C33_35275 [Sinorhizobium meliloti]WQP36161.1 hypothetical protein U8C45_37325 [Sinorhizobium meliloti]
MKGRRGHAAGDLESIRHTRLALKDTMTTPVGVGFRSVNVRLRESFGRLRQSVPRTLVPGGPRGYRYRADPNLEGFYVAAQHFIAVCDDPQAVAISTA